MCPQLWKTFTFSIVHMGCLSAFWLRSSVVSVLIILLSEDNILNAFWEQGDGRSFLHPLRALTWYHRSRNGAPSRGRCQVSKVSLSWGGGGRCSAETVSAGCICLRVSGPVVCSWLSGGVGLSPSVTWSSGCAD